MKLAVFYLNSRRKIGHGMSRWGLRWIFCWLGVIVTACTQLVSPTPATKTETPTPLSTLPFWLAPTLDQSSRGPTTPDTRLVTLEPTPILTIMPPDCYEQPNGTLICLGWLTNNSLSTADQVVVTIRLVTQQGILLDEVHLSPDIGVILPQQRIPYRAIFSNTPEMAWHPQADVEWLEPASIQQATLVLLPPQDVDISWRGNDYAIMGSFTNVTDELIQLIQVITTIENQQRLSGLRVYSFEVELEPNDTFPFEVALAPLDGEEGMVSVMGFGTIR